MAVAHRNLAALLGSDAVMRLHAACFAFAEISATDDARLLAAAIAGFTRTADGRLPVKWVHSLKEGLAASGERLDVLISTFAQTRVARAPQSQSPRCPCGRANQGSRTRVSAGLETSSANPMTPRAKL